MSERIQPFVAKSNEPITAYGQELRPDEALGILLNHPYECQVPILLRQVSMTF